MILNRTFPGRELCLGLIGLTLIFATTVSATPPELWGELEPGEFGVGFQTIEKFDHSRSFRPARDYFGQPLEGETARPIQICLWYPAQVRASDIPMVYAEYSFPYPADGDFVDFLTNLQNRDLGALFFTLANNQAQVQNSMDLDLFAVRDAVPLDGPFPLLIYHAGNRSGYSQNAVMCEYLASHGYIVATTHTFGTWANNPSESTNDFETMVRDKEIVLEAVRELPYVDMTNKGLLGYGFGGATALIQQMRQSGINALATIHGSFLNQTGAETLMQHPFFDPLRQLTPWLNLYGFDPAEPPTAALSDTLKYCQRFELPLESYGAMDLSTYALIGTVLAPDSARPPEIARIGHDLMCRSVLDFFDAYVKGGGTFSGEGLTAMAPEEVPPSPIQFMNIVQTGSLAVASELAAKFDLFNPDHPVMPGQNITNLGYQFLQRGRTEDALIVFRWGVTAFPGSANGWDSYGEACSASGNVELALECYEKAHELIPTDSTLTPAFRELLETNIPPILEELKQRLAAPAATGE